MTLVERLLPETTPDELVAGLRLAQAELHALGITHWQDASIRPDFGEVAYTTLAGRGELTGRVVKGSVRHRGEGLRFRVADRDNVAESIPVTYTGTVPDPFRGGREIVLAGTVERGVFVGERDTLVTKCPSKFTTANAG